MNSHNLPKSVEKDVINSIFMEIYIPIRNYLIVASEASDFKI